MKQQEGASNNINDDGKPFQKRTLTASRRQISRRVSDNRSVASSGTTRSLELCKLKSEEELAKSSAAIEKAEKDADDLLKKERKTTVLDAGKALNAVIIKDLTEKNEQLKHPDLLLKTQHMMFSVPKNCSNIEIRRKVFLIKSSTEKVVSVPFDSKEEGNMFLSKNKYCQGDCPYSDEPTGDLKNVYICEIKVRNVNNRTKNLYGVYFACDGNEGDEILAGNVTHPPGGKEKTANLPFHFIASPGYESTKDFSVHVNSSVENKYSELFPYMTSSRQSIKLNTKIINHEVCIPKVHPISYWVQRNYLKYENMPAVRSDTKYNFIKRRTYETAVTELSRIMQSVSIVNIATLKACVVKLESEESRQTIPSLPLENFYFEAEITYLFRKYSNTVGIKQQLEKLEEEAVEEVDEEEDYDSLEDAQTKQDDNIDEDAVEDQMLSAHEDSDGFGDD